MLQRSVVPLRTFMFQQLGVSGMNDLATFMSMARMAKPDDFNDVPTHVLIPAFMTSELKKAFMMGFMIFVPFLILDIVTSSVLILDGYVSAAARVYLTALLKYSCLCWWMAGMFWYERWECRSFRI